MRPKVSVIIPCYNVEQYLDRCLSTIVNQTLKELEIILIDDKSPDGTPQKCDEWAKKDSRIKVIHKSQNEGLGYARNTGLEMATGEYVAFVDSDDFVDVNMYHILYEKASNNNADTVYCNSVIYESETNIKKRNEVKIEVKFEGRQQVDGFLLDIIGPEPESPHFVKYMMSVWHAIYKGDLIDSYKIRFVSERQFVSEDAFFDIDYLHRAERIVFIPNHLYYYCLNAASLSHTYSIEKYNKIKGFLCAINHKLESLFAKDIYYYHYLRLVYHHLFSSLRFSYMGGLEMSMNEVLNDDYWMPLINDYPYRRMNMKHRLLFFCMKHRMLRWVIKAFFSLNNHKSR